MSTPRLVLSTASNTPTAALPETVGLSHLERAVERFAITGNAIGDVSSSYTSDMPY